MAKTENQAPGGSSQQPIVAPTASIGQDAMLGPGCVVEDDVVVGERAMIVTDRRQLGRTVIKRGANVGPGAVVHGPLTVGVGAEVRAGAVVLDDVPARAVVAGNPAVVVDYNVPDTRLAAPMVRTPREVGDVVDVCGASLVRLPHFADLRGRLSVAELGAGLPFTPERVFFTYAAPSERVRGSHAHKTLHECLIATGGALTVVIDNGRSSGQVTLDEPTLLLHIPPGLWATQYSFGVTTTLVVLASHTYDEADYIRDYDEYIALYG